MFVERENGLVIGVFGRPQPGYAEEELPDDHQDILEFFKKRSINSLPQLTMRQFRLGLLGAGLLPVVDAAIAAMPEPDKSVATIEFEYATTVVRNHNFVVSLSAALGLTDAQVDALWQQALVL